MVELRTKRLTLRPIAACDTGDFLALAGQWSVARMTSDIPHPLSVRDARRWTSPCLGEVRLAILLDGGMVGAVGYFRDRSGAGELGYWLGRPWWGHGIATEAADAVIRHGFNVDRLPAFSSSYFVDNPASGRVLAKLGFRAVAPARIWSEARQASLEAMMCRLDAPSAIASPTSRRSRQGLLRDLLRRTVRPRHDA
jgi:RimJ/RimL family protein N-acetyltransferase